MSGSDPHENVKPVYLVTHESLPDLSKDDQSLCKEIRLLGYPASPQIWNDPNVRWGAAGVVVIRSTWDYYMRPGDFLTWVDRTASVTRLLNSSRLVRWNLHKRYLRELEARGVPTIPTAIVRQARPCGAADIFAEYGWESCVVKPAISCNAFSTAIFRNVASSAGIARMDAHLRAVLRSSDALIQPVVEETFEIGERSLVFLAGTFSHAIEKCVDEQSLRVPLRRKAYEPSIQEIDFSCNVLGVLSEVPAYARIDLVQDTGGRSLLLEIELIEPSLYFSFAPESACRFASYLVSVALRDT